MSGENVVSMPDDLERLGRRIKALLGAVAANRAEFINISVDLAVELHEARGKFPADQDFGKWWRESGFSEQRIDINDRAALVEMGGDPERLRAVLESCSRVSYRTIRADVWPRFNMPVRPAQSVRGDDAPPQRKPHKARRPPEVKQSQRSINIRDDDWQALKQKAQQEGATVADKIGETLVQNLLGPTIDPATLPKTTQEKLAAAKRQMEHALRREHAARMAGLDEEVRQRVIKGTAERLVILEEMEKKAYEKVKDYEDIIDKHRAIFTIEEFRKIVKVLRADHRASITEKQYDEAFDLVMTKKLQLTKER